MSPVPSSVYIEVLQGVDDSYVVFVQLLGLGAGLDVQVPARCVTQCSRATHSHAQHSDCDRAAESRRNRRARRRSLLRLGLWFCTGFGAEIGEASPRNLPYPRHSSRVVVRSHRCHRHRILDAALQHRVGHLAKVPTPKASAQIRARSDSHAIRSILQALQLSLRLTVQRGSVAPPREFTKRSA